MEGLRDEHEVATAYDEYQMRNQHEADDDNLRGVPEIDLEHESQSAAPLTKQWETNVTGIEPSDANQGDNQADGRSSQISPSLPLTLNVNIRPTAPTQSEQLHSHIAPQVSSRISMLVTSQYVLEDEGPQEDTHSTPSRHIPPPRIFLEEESRCEEETEAVHSATPLPPPPRILPHSPEDDYQSESEPTPIPLPRSSRKSISLRPVFSESGGPPTDRDSIVATRPRRPIPPPPMQNDSQESLDTPTLLLDPDKLEEKEEILPTPPPRRSRPPRDVPRFQKESMVDSETEGLVVISVPSARMRLPSAHSSLSHQLVSPLVEERPPLYHTTPSLSVEGQEVIDESEGGQYLSHT